jgi:hypothetical protein
MQRRSQRAISQGKAAGPIPHTIPLRGKKKMKMRKRARYFGVALTTTVVCALGVTVGAPASASPFHNHAGKSDSAAVSRYSRVWRHHHHSHSTLAPTPTPTPTPTPAPTSTPTPIPAPGVPAGYKLFFEDEFDNGSLANFVQGSDNTGKISVDKASGTATFTLPAGVSEPRVELSINKSNQHFTEGSQFVLEQERWLAPGTVPAGPGHHFTIAQFKGLEGRFPMVSEEYGNYNSQGTGLYVQDKNRTTNANYKVANYALGTWHTDRIYVSVSKVKHGAYTLTVDGTQVANVSGVNTLESADSYGFIKIGAYGQPEGKAIEMKLRNIRLYVPA